MSYMNSEQCYQIITARDARFDGKIFVGVTTTGIYCRPICPAVKPKIEHCLFYKTSAAAQNAGFRPCLRCRPESSPGIGVWQGTSSTVSRALMMIEEGALDGPHTSVERLASRLGIGERHLRRLFKEHVGASPTVVAQTRRVLFAKKLLHETRLPVSEIALVSGFDSIRRFNECFQSLIRKSPSELRKLTASAKNSDHSNAPITLYLNYVPPYNWEEILHFLSLRIIDGIEYIAKNCYHRSFCFARASGHIAVAHEPEKHALRVMIETSSTIALPSLVSRIRRVFDLDADITSIEDYLSQDKKLSPLIVKRRGLRLPGAWDHFEMGVRAILGQQVTLAAARKLASHLTVSYGMKTGFSSCLEYFFPTAEDVLKADLSQLKMPGARKKTLQNWSHMFTEPSFHETSPSLDQIILRLKSIRGIGEWTAHYIALRAFRETDAFPASDVGLLRVAETWSGQRPTPEELGAIAEKWRPWRAYAAQHLWAEDAEYSRK